MRTKLRGKFTLLFVTLAVMLAIPAIALADELRSSHNTFTADASVLSLQSGGASDTVTVRLNQANRDGDDQCNVDSDPVQETLRIKAQSSNSSAATVKWAANGSDTISFLGCSGNDARNLTVTSGSQGTANITFSIVTNTTGSGTYDLTEKAPFTVNVAPPPNTAPNVSVTGVQDGATYEHGAVPAAGCNVVDAEDTNESATPVKDSSGLNSNGLGLQTITCSYTDAGGLTTATRATYTIQDTTKPVIAEHADVTAEATSANGAVVNYANPTANDAVYGSVNVDCAPASGSQFALGSTKVTCDATDGSGNAAVATTFNVIVKDTIAPTLTVPSDPVVVEATGPTGAVATYEVTAEDAVDSSLSISCTPATGTVFGLGTTKVSCTATDDAGNTSADSFTVTVRDTTAPSLTLPANKTVEATGPGGAAVSFNTSASDLVDGSITPNCDAASGDTFALGTTTVTCTATDAAGNKSTDSFTVTVRDTTAPSLSNMPANINATATSANGAVVNYNNPTATDAVDPNPQVTCQPASGSTFKVGTTQVSCTATDNTGNTSAASTFNVTVAYSWSNFHQPINTTANTSPYTQSVFKLGSTVPVKFNLTGASAGITDGTFYLKYAYVGAGDGQGEFESVATTTGTTGTEFRYSAGQYIYNWSTKSVAKPGNYELRVYSDAAGTVLLGKVSIEIKK